MGLDALALFVAGGSLFVAAASLGWTIVVDRQTRRIAATQEGDRVFDREVDRLTAALKADAATHNEANRLPLDQPLRYELDRRHKYEETARALKDLPADVHNSWQKVLRRALWDAGHDPVLWWEVYLSAKDEVDLPLHE